MNGFILYIIKSTLYVSVFQSFYLLVMRRTTFFRLNRIVFIAGTFLCLALPFIKVQIPAGAVAITPIALIEDAISTGPVTLQAAVVGAEEPLNLTRLITCVILLSGAFVSFTVTAISYFRMYRMIRSVKTVIMDKGPVKIVEEEIPSFSWGRHIVIGRQDLEENPAILTHERMHVRCGHSFDIMAYTIVTVLQWFNPLVWIARDELKMLHEYEADELTISKGIDATRYQLLLVKKAVGAKRFRLANGFNHSKLKNRITMMRKNKTNKWMRLAYLLCVPALIGAMCCCSQNKAAQDEEEVSVPFRLVFMGCTAHIYSDDGLLDATVTDFGVPQIEDIINTARHSKINIDVTIGQEVGERMTELLKGEISGMNVNKEIGGVTYATAQTINFMEADEKPTFQGGDANTFSRWVNSNLEYPDEAIKKGIQGRVTLSFTVSSSGKVRDVKVLKGVDPQLDEEAVRVIEESPAWTPGKKDGKRVAVTYTFPVIFKLRDPEASK